MDKETIQLIYQTRERLEVEAHMPAAYETPFSRVEAFAFGCMCIAFTLAVGIIIVCTP